MAEAVRLSRISAVMLGVRDMTQALALFQCGTVMLGLSRGHVNLAPHVAGATEVVFAVENVRAAHKALSAKGVAFINEPRQATPTDWVAHFKDPDGHILSIFGPEGQS